MKRDKLDNLKDFIKIKSNIIISGVRRCGKSVFLSQIMDKYFDKFYYFNFEDERLSSFDVMDFNKAYEVLVEVYGRSKVFFLDEVQNIEGWERWVRRLYDKDFKFFITGSNASMLSKELATRLTGRHLSFSIYPFSFKEFLRFKNFKLAKDDFHLTERRALMKRIFEEYLELGGFPEHVTDTRIEILQEYFNTILRRDVSERHNIKNVKQLKELARFLITNVGRLSSYNQLKRLTHLKSVSTIIKYLSYLEESYLILPVLFFSYSLKSQIKQPFKVYCIDHAMRNAISSRFSKDEGWLYENIIAVELRRRNKELYYWKNQDKEEIDFVIKKGLKVNQLIQVCSDMDDPYVEKREVKALLKASKELKCRNLLIITKEKEGEKVIDKKKIKYMPLWKWLLS
ncbi:MAG: ATP-binding protein [Nanoarchaeota archaeon]|nr:ATP-binding protein [Nanoarchaeota archaeon]